MMLHGSGGDRWCGCEGGENKVVNFFSLTAKKKNPRI